MREHILDSHPLAATIFPSTRRKKNTNRENISESALQESQSSENVRSAKKSIVGGNDDICDRQSSSVINFDAQMGQVVLSAKHNQSLCEGSFWSYQRSWWTWNGKVLWISSIYACSSTFRQHQAGQIGSHLKTGRPIRSNTFARCMISLFYILRGHLVILLLRTEDRTTMLGLAHIRAILNDRIECENQFSTRRKFTEICQSEIKICLGKNEERFPILLSFLWMDGSATKFHL